MSLYETCFYFTPLKKLECTFTSMHDPSFICTKEYKIDQVSVVNVGDGRLLYRDLTTENPLNDEHRIIDGYHSAYLLASFKDGFYDGSYKEISG